MESHASTKPVSMECDSLDVFDLILSDNFQKDSEDLSSSRGTYSETYSSNLVDIGKPSTAQHDDNVELYDIIARDNFHNEDIYTADISTTVLSDLPGENLDKSTKTSHFPTHTTDHPAQSKSLKDVNVQSGESNNEAVLNISRTPDACAEEYSSLVAYCDETRLRLQSKSSLRKSNLNPLRDESKLSKLDSSLKKNSAFVKKLKNFTLSQLDALLKDLTVLNLSKYMSEVTSALVEVKLKLTDVPPVLTLCTELHRVYSEFSKLFFEQWTRVLSLKKDDKIVNASKLRVDLRFYGDLIISGIFQTKEAFCLLGNVLTFLIMTDKEEHSNLSIVSSFCKYCGEDYAGLVPKHIQSLARKYNVEVPRSDLIPVEKQRNVRQLLLEYFQSLCKHILKENSELKNLERQNQRILESKGELRQERRDQFEARLSSLRKLTSSGETLAELIGETLPEIPRDKCVSDEAASTGNIVSICGTESEDGGNGPSFNSIWEDEEMQSFYQDIPFLKDFLPHLKVKVTSPVDAEEPWKSRGPSTPDEIITEDKMDEAIDKLTLEDDELNAKATDETSPPNDIDAMAEGGGRDKEGRREKETSPVAETSGGRREKEVSPAAETSGGGGLNVNNVVKGGGIDVYLANLYKCENREMIDNAAIEFIMYHNTRTNRKKLSQTLLFVPRTRLDLLPFLSRFVAILHPFQPDISTDLINMLKNDFKYHTKKKDQINIESKIKNVRYIGELVKFKIYSKVEVLYCLKVLLNDFAHHHVEMCCHLLETCGRYLYRSKDTHPRLKIYLEQMIRKRTVLNLDARYNMMIENAFYCVNPPEVPVSKKKDKPDMLLFIEKIVYVDLMNTMEKEAEAKVLSYLLKLDWNDETVVKYLVRVFSQPWQVKYDLIGKLANVLAGLVETAEGEAAGVQVVDGVTEDIRACLEYPHPRHNQRRLAQLKYFGELYNYRLIESNDVFKVLYSLITFGVPSASTPPPDPSLDLDPPDNLFRIKLVCVLLETCAEYFSHGITRTKLDYFFVFFQTYFWSKYSHPCWKDKNDVASIVIRNYYREVVTSLRPHIRLAKSYPDALKARDELVGKLRAKLKPLGEITNRFDGMNANRLGSEGMGVIQEEGEEEDGKEKKMVGGRESKGGKESAGGKANVIASDKAGVGVADGSKGAGVDGSGGRKSDVKIDDGDETEEYNEEGVFDDDEEEPITEEYSEELPVCGDEDKENELLEEEDDEFINEFEKMMSDNLQERTRETVGKNKLTNMSVPVNFLKSNLKTYDQLNSSETDKAADSVNFMLMIRSKSNKQSYKPLVVPPSCDLVMNLKSRTEAKKHEMEVVKKLTLNITDRLEEEEYAENEGGAVGMRNLNHHRGNVSHRMAPPKGPYTPDAELIFGRPTAKKAYGKYS